MAKGIGRVNAKKAVIIIVVVSGACVAPSTPSGSSTMMFAPQAEGYAITTVEAMSPAPGELGVIQDAFCAAHGMQCGYCTPGMILTAVGLLTKTPNPTDEQIVAAVKKKGYTALAK